MENYKELLSALYKEHAPEKLDQIDFYLDRYKGKEKQFYITQKAKYANKKSVKDSKKILEEAMARINKRKEEAKAVLQEEKEKEEKKNITSVELKKEEPKPAPQKTVEKKVVPSIEKVIPKEEIKKEAKPIEKKPVAKPVEKVIVKKEEINPPIIKKVKVEEKTEIKEKKIEEPKKETPPVVFTSAEQKRMEDLKAKKSDFAASRKSLHEEQVKEEDERKKKRLPVFWYFGIAAVVLIALAIFIYFSYFHNSTPEQEPIHVQKVVVEKKAVNTDDSKTAKTDQKESQAKESDTKKEDPKPVVEKKQEQAPVKKQEEPKPVKKKQTIKSTADRIYASDINRPAIFVGCYAVKQENLAQKKVEQLKALNLDAHYYWIPDMDANGNNFFKVVVGPFNSVQEAYPSLTKVQERINFDAYIIVVN